MHALEYFTFILKKMQTSNFSQFFYIEMFFSEENESVLINFIITNIFILCFPLSIAT
jgi:hypothetical protein